MDISKDKVVSLHYIISDPDGKELDSTAEAEPLVYLHGHNAMLPALEKVLEGKTAGESISVNLKPEEAFGQRSDENIQRIPLKYLQPKSVQKGRDKWQPGMQVIASTPQGRFEGVIAKAGHTMATVDFNHPFAGLTLNFDLSVKDVRDASEEELAHGHVHGPGGHHH